MPFHFSTFLTFFDFIVTFKAKKGFYEFPDGSSEGLSFGGEPANLGE
jgi:hypothetical protein